MSNDLASSALEWLIWSYEHDAWWRPNRLGYTHSLEQAGRYTMAEALSICEDANHQPVINEIMVHESAAIGFISSTKQTKATPRARSASG